MFLNMLYYPSIIICFITCGLVTFEWLKFLFKSRKEDIRDQESAKI